MSTWNIVAKAMISLSPPHPSWDIRPWSMYFRIANWQSEPVTMLSCGATYFASRGGWVFTKHPLNYSLPKGSMVCLCTSNSLWNGSKKQWPSPSIAATRCGEMLSISVFMTIHSSLHWRVVPAHLSKYSIVSAFHLLSGGFTTMSVLGDSTDVTKSFSQDQLISGGHIH